MSVFNAYDALDSSIGWKVEAEARFRRFLERRLVPLGRSVDAFLRGDERSLETSFSADGPPARVLLRSLKGLKAWVAARVGRRHAGVEVEAVDPEFERVCARVLEHGRRETIEGYASYLFTIDVKL